MRTWKNNGYIINEVDYDYDLHAFEVYKNGNFLGGIYPDDIANMESCIKDLDSGKDPVTDGWDDGCGNGCTEDGWGQTVDDND